MKCSEKAMNLTGGQVVDGSNPVVPTNNERALGVFSRALFSCETELGPQLGPPKSGIGSPLEGGLITLWVISFQSAGIEAFSIMPHIVCTPKPW